VGFIFILYDRIYLRGVDYTMGLRLARYAWLDSPSGNFIGIVGNILNSFGYFSLAISVLEWGKLDSNKKIYTILSVLFSVVGLSMLNGGRANIMVAGFYIISIINSSTNINIIYFFKKNVKKTSILLLISIIPIILIINSSASLGSYTPKEQYEADTVMLYGFLSTSAAESDYDDILYTIYYMIIYLFHGQWTAQVATELPPQDPFYTIYPISAQLNQIGLSPHIPISGYFSDSGAFISLPGAIFYDYGYSGLLFISFLFGLALGIALSILQYSKEIGPLRFIYVILVNMTFLMSPFSLSYGFSVFFIIPIPFFCFFAYNKLLSGNSYNILINKRVY
jgi:hypothetical protein